MDTDGHDPEHGGCACAAPREPEEASSLRPETGDGGPWLLFDDLILRQNDVTDSEIFPIENKNRVLISGVVIARTAVATVTFIPLVSTDGVTWSGGGTALNVSTLGYFSNSGALAFNLNARFLKVRASMASAAVVSLASSVRVSRI